MCVHVCARVCVSVRVVAICQEWAAIVMRVRQGRQQYLRVLGVCVCACVCVCVYIDGRWKANVGARRDLALHMIAHHNLPHQHTQFVVVQCTKPTAIVVVVRHQSLYTI